MVNRADVAVRPIHAQAVAVADTIGMLDVGRGGLVVDPQGILRGVRAVFSRYTWGAGLAVLRAGRS